MSNKILLSTMIHNVSTYPKLHKYIDPFALSAEDQQLLDLIKRQWNWDITKQAALSTHLVHDEMDLTDGLMEFLLQAETNPPKKEDIDYVIQKVEAENQLLAYEKIQNELNEKLKKANDFEKAYLINQYAKKMEELSRQKAMRYENSLEETVEDTYRKKQQAPIPTGYGFLDEAIGGGIYRKNLSIIAADSGGGKSLNQKMMALSMAKSGKKVLLISVEMTKELITEQMVATINGKPLSEWKSFKLTENQREMKYQQALELAKETKGNLFIDDGTKNPLTPERIINLIDTANDFNYDCIFLDYVQAVQLDEGDDYNKFSSRLTSAIKKTNAALVVLSQLTIAKGEKPKDANLRYARQLWNDANLALYVWREIDEDEEEIEFQKEDGEHIYFYLKKNRQDAADIEFKVKYFPSLGVIGEDWQAIDIREDWTKEDDTFNIFNQDGGMNDYEDTKYYQNL